MDLKLKPIPKALYTFLNKKWHFDQIVNEFIVIRVMNFGYSLTFQSVDKGLIEQLGPAGFTASIFTTSSNFVSYYSGLLHHTAFVFILFMMFFLSFFALGSFGILSAFNSSFVLLFLSFLSLAFFDPFNQNK
jgi:hypothetical protein